MRTQPKHIPITITIGTILWFTITLLITNVIGIERNEYVSMAIGIPCAIAWWTSWTYILDGYRQLKNQESYSKTDWLLWLFYAPFYHFIGFWAILMGSMICLWIPYNLLIERHPSFNSWGPIWVGPGMIAYGISRYFKKSKNMEINKKIRSTPNKIVQENRSR